MTPTKPPDDLDALRTVIDAVKDFSSEDQQRIFRWAAEKLGLPMAAGPSSGSLASQAPLSPSHSVPHTPSGQAAVEGSQDIKSFVAAKNPRSDVQFAAAVAYYFQFVAPPSQRKGSINGEDLQDACRKVGRDRLKLPGQTLRNAHTLGLLDKGAEAGTFSVNTVGENLVAMTLPGDGNSSPLKRKSKGKAKQSVKNAAKKSAPSKKPTKA